MNQGRIWCVVHPTVGLPLFLGSVALTSLAVHTAVMTHTSWMSSYWAGSTRNKPGAVVTGSSDAATPGAASAFSMTVTPVPASAQGTPASFVITVRPNDLKATTTATEPAAPPPATPIKSASAD